MRRIVSLLLILLMVSGCEKKYELVASSKYNSYVVDFKLESDVNKVIITGKCDSGTITVSSDDIDGFKDTVSEKEYTREIEFKDNDKDLIKFLIELN